MLIQSILSELKQIGRSLSQAESGDARLGPLKNLPGTWKNTHDHGWNSIALPYVTTDNHHNYRLLLNKYIETLTFSVVDAGVPNRGVEGPPANSVETDQFVATLDYEQRITQVLAADHPKSNKAGGKNLKIHREPGLWLHMWNQTTDGFDIARLSTVPHGDSILALGKAKTYDGPPQIPVINGLPMGVHPRTLENHFLSPYKYFNENLFDNLFDPSIPNKLLETVNQGVNIKRTTEITVDTTFGTGGIVNIPFNVKHAKSAEMRATFWIQELDELDENGEPKLRLQYSQTVILEFFHQLHHPTQPIQWPHVSINTMEKVGPPPS